MEDIGILIIDNLATSYTHAVFIELMEAGAAVVLCASNHHPAGIFLPIDSHSTQTARHRAQAEASLPFKKQSWSQIIAAKLRQQALVLQAISNKDVGLAEMANRVRSGDPDNYEAQGALRYWKALFGPSFRRGRNEGGANKALNYGYAIVRAAVARAIVGSGLIPSLGLHHHHRANPFCLADDLMEPYRPLVDFKVCELARSGHAFDDLDKPAKITLLSLFNETIKIADRHSPVGLAIYQTTSSLAKSLEEGQPNMALPTSLFFRKQSKKNSKENRDIVD